MGLRFFFNFSVLGLELRASRLLSRSSTTKATLPALCVLGVFEIGFHEQFVWAGFEQ
jgi:hypothetical protein